jgi:hypothetical protein
MQVVPGEARHSPREPKSMQLELWQEIEKTSANRQT